MKKIMKKKLQWRKGKLMLFCFIGIIFILITGNIILNKVIENKVRENLDQLSPIVKVSFSAVHANLFTSSLSISDLAIQFNPDTTDKQHQHFFYFPKAEFAGISFLKVIFKQELSINKLKLESGKIKLDESILDKKDSVQNALLQKTPFKNILIDHLEMTKMNVWLHSTTNNKLLMKGSINIDDISVNNLNKSSSENNFGFNGLECNISDINYSIPGVYHTVQIKNLLLDSKKNLLKIDSLKIIPQYSKSEFAEKTQHQINRFEASISTIEISKLDVMDLLNKKFIAGNILINEGDINVVNSKGVLKSSQAQALPVTYLNQIPEEIRIDAFKINHSSFKCEGFSNEDLQSNKNIFDSINLKKFSINQFEIAETKVALSSNGEDQFNIEKFDISNLNKSKSDFHFDAIACGLSNIDYSIPNTYRTLHVNSLMIDSRKELLLMDSLRIATQYSKFEFGRKLGHQADFIETTTSRLEILKLNVMQLLYKRLVADEMILDNTNVYVFRDRRLPRELKKQPMPNGYFKEIPFEIRVNTVKINNASVVSEEFPKKGTQSGTFKIEKINLVMSPVINHPGKNDPLYSNTSIEGSIMDAGIMQATISASLDKNIYFIKGAITNLDLPKLNPSSENLGNFHIESGMLNNLDFHFTATDEKATGKIVGEYHDLVIDRLKDKNGSKEVAKVPTFLLKHLIIPKNKDKSMDVAKRTGEIDYDRDPTRIVSFYLLKALLSGVESSFDLGFLLPK